MTYIILSIIIAGVGVGAFFWIKKLYSDIKHIQFKLDFAERQIEQTEGMVADYKKLLIDKAIRGKKDNEYIEKVKTASGDVLTDLANSM